MSLTFISKYYFVGWIILISAIGFNAVAKAQNISTWYDLFENLQISGLKYLNILDIQSYIFLLIVYPLLLGISAYIGKLIIDQIL